MNKTIWHCLAILQDTNPDATVKEKADMLLNLYNSGISINTNKEALELLHNNADFINDNNEFDISYTQGLAIFLKYAEKDFEALDDVLMGMEVPRHLLLSYEREGIAIREKIIADGKLPDVINFAKQYGFIIK